MLNRCSSLCLFLMLAALTVGSSSSSAWVWTSPKDALGPRVSGQTAASTTAMDRVLLFGGLTGAAGSPTTNELWIYDHTTSNSWKKVNNLKTSATPRRRMYAASACSPVGNKFYLFGGWDPGEPGSGGEFLNDIWCLDMDQMEWKKQDTVLPFPVSRHAACAVGGGKNNNNMIVLHTYQGVLVYDCSTDTLRVQPTTTKEQEGGGGTPDGLSMCAMAPIGESSVLLFGGSTKTQQLSGDTYVLDTTNWVWRKLVITSRDALSPGSRASSNAAQVGENQVLVFGGAAIGKTGYEGGMGLIPKQDTWLVTVNGDKVEWTKLFDTTNSDATTCCPESRLAASLNPLGNGEFLLQGGYDSVSKETYEKPWILSKKSQ